MTLKAMGIEAVVTIYHWDHPVVLEKMGGWTKQLMLVDWFAADYARVVFDELMGDRFRTSVAINEILRIIARTLMVPGKKLHL